MAKCPLPSSASPIERAPKISVLVPTYNYARYLPQAIESIQAQKYDDLEILISDDASTDDSARIIEHYAARDPRIRFVRHASNLGMVANWNWCLQQARGDFVKFIFGDDLLTSPDALTRLAATLDAHPEATLVASARLLLNHNSAITGTWDHLSGGVLDGPELIARCLRTRRNLVGEPSTVMFRRCAGKRGFDPAYRQIVDLEMWFHLLMQGSLVYLPEPLCGFRQHASQQTVFNGRLRVTDLELIDLLERYQQFPEIQRHLRPDGWAYRWILFRQLHYAKKANQLPGAAAAMVRLKNQIPRHWQIIYWARHRLSRPLENLFRKTTQWTQALRNWISLEAAIRRKRQENFLRSLPPLTTPSRETPRPKSGEELLRSAGDFSELFQNTVPRWIAAGMLILGAVSAIGIFLETRSIPPRGPFSFADAHLYARRPPPPWGGPPRWLSLKATGFDAPSPDDPALMLFPPPPPPQEIDPR